MLKLPVFLNILFSIPIFEEDKILTLLWKMTLLSGPFKHFILNFIMSWQLLQEG